MSMAHMWHRIAFVCATLVFVFGLHFIYRNSLAVHWAYYGYGNNLTALRALLAVLSLFMSATILYLSRNDFVRSFHTMIFFWMMCPVAIFAAYNTHGVLLVSGALLFQAILFLYDILIPDNFQISSAFPSWLFYTFLFGVAGLACFALLRDFGIPLGLDALSVTGDEAKVRLHAREVGSSLSGYFSSFLGSVVAPILIVLGLARKQRLLLVLGVLFLFYIFLCYGSKVTLFSIVLIIGFASRSWRWFRLKFAVLNAGLIISACVLHFLNPFNIFAGLFINRMLMVPVLNSSNYIDFFSINGVTALSQSRLNPFHIYPFDQHPAFLIGARYYDQEALSANVGYPGEAFMNFGFSGFIIVPLIISVFFIILRNGRISAYFAGLVLLQFTNFTGSSFTTFLVTHGFLLLTLLIMAWPNQFLAKT